MPDKLTTLIEAARRVQMSEKQKEEQRRSFAYGNTKIENELITKETVSRQAESIPRANDE